MTLNYGISLSLSLSMGVIGLGNTTAPLFVQWMDCTSDVPFSQQTDFKRQGFSFVQLLLPRPLRRSFRRNIRVILGPRSGTSPNWSAMTYSCIFYFNAKRNKLESSAVKENNEKNIVHKPIVQNQMESLKAPVVNRWFEI